VPPQALPAPSTGIAVVEKIYLWEILQEASENPQSVEWYNIWQALDTALVDLDIFEQLALAGEAVSQMSLIFQSRSKLAFEELDALTSDEGPVMPSDAFAQFVRQSMHIDFSEFIEPRKPDGRKPYEKQGLDDITSVAVAVDKQDLLDVLEDWKVSPVLGTEDVDSVLAVSHAENISDWVKAIAQALTCQFAEYFMVVGVDVVGWSELCDKITISPVEIWLGLLLGNFVLRQTEGVSLDSFYDSEIFAQSN
jgi:hypothetical protein